MGREEPEEALISAPPRPDINGKNQIAAARIEISSAVFQK
jgi:hypothetical protein